MDKEALKKTTSLNLRCVTQSCKGGVPLSRLQNDYKNLIGTAIPVKDLGYGSLEVFLQNLPDVVCLRKNNAGQLMVEGVADASTAHIASLITRQKSTKSSGKGTSKKPSLQIKKYACHEGWRSSSTNSGVAHKPDKNSVIHPPKSNMPMLKTSHSESAPPPMKKEVPPKKKKATSVKNEGTKNPTGESTQVEVTTLTGSEPLSTASKNSEKQHQVQQKVKLPSKAMCNNLDVQNELLNVPRIPQDTDLTKNQRRRRNYQQNKRKKQEKLLEASEDTLEFQKENWSSSSILPIMKQPQDNHNNSEKLKSLIANKQQLMESISKNLRKVTLCRKGGVPLNDLHWDYESLIGTPIPYRHLGYLTLEAFIQSIPDVISLKTKKDGQVFAEAVTDYTTAHISNLVSMPKQPKTITSTIVSPPETVQPPASSVPVSTGIFNQPFLPSFFAAQQCDNVSPSEVKPSTLQYQPTLKCFSKIKNSILSAEFSSLLLLNFLLFGDDSFTETLKRGILTFDGFPFSEGSEQWKQKELLLSMLSENTLKECLKLLCLECDSDNKEVLLHNLMQFLVSPSNFLSDTTKKDETEELKWDDRNNLRMEITSVPTYANVLKRNSEHLNQEYIMNPNLKDITEVKGDCVPSSKSVNISVVTGTNACLPSSNIQNGSFPVRTRKRRRKKSKSVTNSTTSEENAATESEKFYRLKKVFRLGSNIIDSKDSTVGPRKNLYNHSLCKGSTSSESNCQQLLKMTESRKNKKKSS